MGPRVKRGDVVTVAAKGHYSGMPCPGSPSDLFSALGHVTICLLPTDVLDAPLFRLTIEPSTSNGLQHISQIMTDKIVIVPRHTIGSRIGALDHELMVRIDRSLAVFLGIV